MTPAVTLASHEGTWSRRRRWILLAVLVALPFAIDARSLGFGLLGIDDTLYMHNPALHGGGFAGLRDVWIKPYFHDYSPITQLTLWLDLRLSPPGHYGCAHLQQLLWLALGTLALFHLLRRLCGDERLAWIVALWWCIHPVVAESVLWLGERKNLVAAALSWWAIERHLAWRHGQGRTSLLVSIVLCVLALLAKPHAVIIPAVIAAYEMILGPGRWRQRALAVLPSALAVLGFLWLTMCLFPLYDSAGQAMLGGSLAAAAWCDGAILARYLAHTLLPQHLSLYYRVEEDPARWPILLGSWAVVFAAVGGSIVAVRDRRLVAFAWCAAGGSLLPVLNLKALPLRMSDHYLHWALPWFLLIIAEVIADLMQRATPAAPGAPVLHRQIGLDRPSVLAYAGLAAFFLLLASARVPDFRSHEAECRAAVAHQPDCAVGWADLCFTIATKDGSDESAAGRAGLAALRCTDADRVFLTPYLRSAILGTLECLRREGAAAADHVLAHALVRLTPLERTFVRGSVQLLSQRAAAAVATLRPLYDDQLQQAAHRVAGRCRHDGLQPWEFPPDGKFVTAEADAGDPDTEAGVEVQALATLCQACVAAGDPATAYDISAWLVNVDPHAPMAARAYRLACQALGLVSAVRRVDTELALHP